MGTTAAVDIDLGFAPVWPQLLAGSLSAVSIDAGSATFGNATLDDVRVVARGVGPKPPHVIQELTIQGIVATTALESFLNRGKGPTYRVSVAGDHLELRTTVSGAEHHLDVIPTIVESELHLALAQPDAVDSPPGEVWLDALGMTLGLETSPSLAWFTDAVVVDAGVLVTARSEAAALYEREAF